jgi:hypothetical protein
MSLNHYLSRKNSGLCVRMANGIKIMDARRAITA